MTLCMSTNTLFSRCGEASEVSQSPTLGVGLHTRVVADVTSNTVTSSLSQRFRKDRNSSFHLKRVSVVGKLQQTCHFFHCGSKLWTLGWWERGDVWGGAQSFTCIPQQGTRRELYYSALTEVVLIYVEQKLQNSGSGLVWQNKNNPQWHSFFGLGHNLLFSYSVVETKKYMSEMLQQTLSWQHAHVETGWLLWWPVSAAACLCWVMSLICLHTLPLVSSTGLLTLKLIEPALVVGEQEGISVSQCTPGAVWKAWNRELTTVLSLGLGPRTAFLTGLNTWNLFDPKVSDSNWALVLSA